MEKSHSSKTVKRFLIATLLLVMAITMGSSLVKGKNVVLNINGREEVKMTYAATVGELISKENIELKEKDLVEPAKDAKIEEGMTIYIKSPRSITIYDGNKTAIEEVQGTTTEEILDYIGIKLNELDRTEPALDERVEDEIKISRVTKETKQVEEVVPFDVLENLNKEMEKGKTKVITPGVDGKRLETIETTYVNGKPESSQIWASELIVEPITEVREVGSKVIQDQVPAGKFNGEEVVAVYTMEATAYDPTAGSKTAIGTRARVGAVAVDPRVIKLRSRLYIESMDSWPSYGYATAEDTGGAIKGKRIDLFFNSNAEALRFGRRNVKVYVLK